jgi:hypothetical protein
LAKGFSRSELLSLARAGAEARIAELQSQIDTIRATFGGGNKGRPAGVKAAAAKPKRKRRKMSKAGRAKIAAAAKARWAKWRKEKGK